VLVLLGALVGAQRAKKRPIESPQWASGDMPVVLEIH